eukprot:PLAT607.2.p1 GENE.PLAT607.2~~PLAT607.2.p1  ORF type:complete len:468 (+),score=206.33 PLAT607.2:145-1404(+)
MEELPSGGGRARSASEAPITRRELRVMRRQLAQQDEARKAAESRAEAAEAALATEHAPAAAAATAAAAAVAVGSPTAREKSLVRFFDALHSDMATQLTAEATARRDAEEQADALADELRQLRHSSAAPRRARSSSAASLLLEQRELQRQLDAACARAEAAEAAVADASRAERLRAEAAEALVDELQQQLADRGIDSSAAELRSEARMLQARLREAEGAELKLKLECDFYKGKLQTEQAALARAQAEATELRGKLVEEKVQRRALAARLAMMKRSGSQVSDLLADTEKTMTAAAARAERDRATIARLRERESALKKKLAVEGGTPVPMASEPLPLLPPSADGERLRAPSDSSTGRLSPALLSDLRRPSSRSQLRSPDVAERSAGEEESASIWSQLQDQMALLRQRTRAPTAEEESDVWGD